MAAPAVLAIGLDPAFADFSATPHLPPELVRGYINAQVARVRELGFEVDTCLIAPGSAAEAEIAAALQARNFECVVIGAGLRVTPEQLLLSRGLSISCIGSRLRRASPSTPRLRIPQTLFGDGSRHRPRAIAKDKKQEPETV